MIRFSSFSARSLCLFFASLLCCIPLVQAQQHSSILSPTKPLRQFTLDTWQTDDGIPQAPIQSIAHTPDGYTWLGTFEGLVRFDGHRFVVFDSSSSVQAFRLPNPSVVSLRVDSKGTMWIAGAAGVWQYRNARFTKIEIPNDNGVLDASDSVAVYAAGPDHEGSLIISTMRGNTFRRDERTKAWSLLHKSDQNARIGQTITPSRVQSNVTWLVLSGRLYQWSHGKLILMDSLAGINSLEEAPNGKLWLGAFSGVYTFHHGVQQHIIGREQLSNPNVVSIFHEVNESVWIATRFGLYRWFQGTLAPYTEQEGLLQPSLYCLHKDPQGSLWIGGVGGILMRLRENSFTTLTKQDGLANNMVRSVFQDSRGTYWFATAEGLTAWNGTTFRSYTRKDGLSEDVITGLYEDHNKTLWVGSASAGLMAMRDGKFTSYTKDDGIPNNAVRVITEDGTHRLWVGTAAGLCYREHGIFRQDLPRSTPFLGRVWSMKRDTSTGAVWIGSANNHLIAVRGDSLLASYLLTHLISIPGMAYPVLTVHPDGRGRVWFGFARGIGYLQDGKIAYVNNKQGLFDDDVYSIIEDTKGNIWVSGYKGVYRIPRAEFDSIAHNLQHRIQYVHFKKNDGLKNAETNGGSQPSVWLAHDGSLWYPTILGAAFTMPAITMPTKRLSKPIIESITTSDTTLYLQRITSTRDSAMSSFGIDGLSSIAFPYSTRKIEINFTLPEFSAQTRLRFRCKLEGFDTEWNEIGNRRTVYYTNLPHGVSFTFRLQCYLEGASSEYAESSCDIMIAERFYTTWWFVVFVLMSVAIGLYLLYRWQIWRIKARNILLEELVHQRTLELKEQSEEIQHINQQLVFQNQRLVEIDNEKNSFFGVVIHDLKNPLASISLSAEILEFNHSGMTQEKRAKIIRDIINATVRMSTLVRNLLNINLIEQGYNNFDIQNHSISVLLDSLIRDYTDKARQKDIQLVTQIDLALHGMVDASAFVQVADNLISNAVKYTSQGKIISIALHEAQDLQNFVLSIRDEGPGFTEQDRLQVFGKFARLSARPTGDESSSGLGLSIAKEYTERMDGSIWFESVADTVHTLDVNHHIQEYLSHHEQIMPRPFSSGTLFIVKFPLAHIATA